MDGELVVVGYKLSEPVHINLQSASILVPQNDFRLVSIIFDFIQRYFDKYRFSNRYQLNSLRINNHDCRDDEFQVLYIRSFVDATELFKLAKKSLLGQVAEAVYSNIPVEDKEACFKLLQDTLLLPINSLLQEYKLICECSPSDFWTLSKIIDLVSNDEYKTLMEFIESCKDMIHASIIYTQNDTIVSIFNNPLQYHIVKESYIYGMEEYDEMEPYINGCFSDERINFSMKSIEFLYSLFNKTQFESKYNDLNAQFFSR